MSRESFLSKLSFGVGLTVRFLRPPYGTKGLLTKLERYCEKRLEKKANSIMTRVFLSEIYILSKQYDKAMHEYFKIEDLGCLNAKELASFAKVLHIVRNHNAIIEKIEPLLNIDKADKADKDLMWYLGFAYMKTGDYRKSIGYLDKAVSLGKTGFKINWSLGFCYCKIGQWDKAEEALLIAISEDPSSLEVKRNLAMVYVEKGDYKKALDFDPQNIDAKRKEKEDRTKLT